MYHIENIPIPQSSSVAVGIRDRDSCLCLQLADSIQQLRLGSSGGGGGSVTPTTPTITVPVSGDENKVNVSATVSGNNAAVKELTDQEVEKVLGASVETGIVEIDLSGLGTEISSATIPTVTINKIADATK